MYIDSVKKLDEFINFLTEYGENAIDYSNIQFSPHIQQLWERYNTAHKLLNSGDKLGAMKLYKQLLNYSPEFVAARYNLAHLYKESNNPDEALKQFKLAAEYNPQDLTILIEIGDTYSDLGKTDQELYTYFKALSINPTYIPAVKNIGLTYLEIDQEDEALLWLHRALKFALVEINIKYSLVLINIKYSQDLDKELIIIYSGLGDTYKKMGNYTESENYYLQGVQFGNRSRSTHQSFRYFETRLWNGLGGLYLIWEKWDQAEKYFLKCLQREPNNFFYKSFLNRARENKDPGYNPGNNS